MTWKTLADFDSKLAENSVNKVTNITTVKAYCLLRASVSVCTLLDF